MSVPKSNHSYKSAFNSYIVFTFLSLFIFGLIDNSRGPIYPKVIEVFGLTKSQSSWMFTLTSLISFIVALSSLKWLKLLGAIRAMKLALVLHVGALALMGGAGLQEDLYWLFLFGSVVLGLAMGAQTVTVNLVISKVANVKNSSRLFSGLHSMYGAASLLAPLILGAIFYLNLSWQLSLFAMALAPMALLIKFKGLKGLNLDQMAAKDSATPLKEVLKLGIVFSFYVACEILLSTRLVIFLFEKGGLPLDQASYLLTGFFVLLLGGRAFFSFIAPPLSGLAMLKLSLGATLFLFIFSLVYSPWPLFLTGLTMSYFFPFGMDFIKKSYKDAEAIIAKVMMFVGAMIAGMHFVFGAVSDFAGIEIAMWIGPMLLMVSLLLLFRITSPPSDMSAAD